MAPPINTGKRFRETAASSSELLPSARVTRLIALDELSKRVDDIYLKISGASFSTPLWISTSLDRIRGQIQDAYTGRPSVSVFREDLYSQLMQQMNLFDAELSRQTGVFDDIKERSFQIIKKVNKLSSLDKQGLSSPSLKSHLDEIHADFLLIARELQDFSEEVDTPVLGKSFAVELETARRKYLQEREVLERKGVISPITTGPIPEFFLYLDIYNYQRTLLPVVHHLIHDKYATGASVAQVARRLCREPTPEEIAKIETAYEKLSPELKENLEEFALHPKYRLSDIPKESGEYYKVKAKALRDLIDTSPYFLPSPVDPRTFPFLEESGQPLGELDEASDSKVDEDGTVHRPPTPPFETSAALTGPSTPPRSTRLVAPRLRSPRPPGQVLRFIDPCLELSEDIDRARLLRDRKPNPEALFDRYVANLSPDDRRVFTQSEYREAAFENGFSHPEAKALFHRAKARFDEYIRAAVENRLPGYIAQYRLPPTTSSLDFDEYTDVVEDAINQIRATSPVARNLFHRSLDGSPPRPFHGFSIDPSLADPSIFSQMIAQPSPRMSRTEGAAPLPLFEDVRDEKAVLIDIYNFLGDQLFKLTEEQRTNPEFLQDLFETLNLPPPILSSFYAHVRDVAVANSRCPLGAEANWAVLNTFYSYEYVERGLFYTLLRMLTQSQRNVFETWFKVSTMPAPRTPDAIRNIIESRNYTQEQTARFYEELKSYERELHPHTQITDLPGWAQENAYTDYNRTRVALNRVLLHELSN